MNILSLLLSLVKMVYKMAEEHRREPRWPEVEHAIRRNFGGLDEIDAVKVFRKYFRGQFSLGRSDTVGVLFSVTVKLVWFLGGTPVKKGRNAPHTFQRFKMPFWFLSGCSASKGQEWELWRYLSWY